MENFTSHNMQWIDSPIGRRLADSDGAPVGVVRLDPERSYAGAGDLLQQVINNSSEEAWNQIKAKIDYTYEGLNLAMAPLLKNTDFEEEIGKRINQGQKVLFKPNLVSPICIAPQTHGPAPGSIACTEWPFVAAVMRWFHDRLGISYHQMSLGEAATAMSAAAGLFSMVNPEGKTVTTEAVMEGRSGGFYGGWGFYFVRKYLAECSKSVSEDDPMQGFEASVRGLYTPPGMVKNELRAVDLNRIEDPAKGREIPVPGGINFQTITLHKQIVGGDPADPEDRQAFPGCILVNLPRLKVHMQALFTNAIKNLGIGLYPMEFSRGKDCCWEYSNPHSPVPGMKGGIPHAVWVPEMNRETCLPILGQDGNPVLKKTGGLTATMVDIVKAVQNQNILMIHIVDAIEPVNLNHMPSDTARRESEGLIFAGLDPVAVDLLCARYMFSNVPLEEAMAVPIEDGAGGRFPQAVPVPTLEENNIITVKGYDCLLARDNCFEQAERRGLGQRLYHVMGWNKLTDSPLISIDGHLGWVKEGKFADVVTSALYFDLLKFPWDLQKTAFSYFSSLDQLTGSSLKNNFLEAFDEDGDGVVSLWEKGKKGADSIFLHQGGYSVSCLGTEPLGFIAGPARTQMKMLKLGDPQRNSKGYDFLREYFFGAACMVAFRMSEAELEAPDLFVPGLTWGKGKWPSFQMAQFISLGISLFGQGFPFQTGFPSLYGSAVHYADLTQRGGQYFGASGPIPDPENLRKYVAAIQQGQDQPMHFVFYVPPGYDNLGGAPLPNVEVSEDPAMVFTARFNGGQETWGAV